MREGLGIVERTVEERERLLLDVVVSLARALRDERDRLDRRLAEVDEQLRLLGNLVIASRPEPRR